MIRTLKVAAVAFATLCLASSSRADVYIAFLNGPSEAPPVASGGTGFGRVDIDDVANTIRVRFHFRGLVGNTTAAHIHAATAVPGEGTAGVATQVPTFPGTPLGVKSGSYDATFNLLEASTYRPAYITANGGTPATAAAALISSLNAGTAYLNIHSTFVGSGEIRGFFRLVPEPSSVVLMGLGVAGLAAYGRRRLRASAA